MARLWASDTAVDRFREKFCPGYPLSRAKRELIALADQARRTEERAPGGEEIWRGGNGGEVMLVVRKGGWGKLPTIVTVVRGEDSLAEDEQ